MIGVVLCGGLSKRMGGDKGLLAISTTTWVKQASNKLIQLGMPVVVSINHDQIISYSEIFSTDTLIIDNPIFSLKGPLCGVMSTHIKYPEDDLFILACDMPLVDLELLNFLIVQYRINQKHQAFYYLNENQAEPLCAIYTASGLAYINQLYQQNKLFKHSMKFVLGQLSVASYILRADQAFNFKNFNDQSDLNLL